VKKVYKLNKRGAIGETILWAVAIIIILILIFVFIFVSESLSEIKKINIFSGENSFFGIHDDIFKSNVEKKNSFAKMENDQNLDRINQWIYEKGEQEK